MKYSEMTNKELKKFILELHDLIHGKNPCYGVRDMINYDDALRNATKRGLNIKVETNLC